MKIHRKKRKGLASPVGSPTGGQRPLVIKRNAEMRGTQRSALHFLHVEL